mmetsp:Transcript_52055/g.153630  ORF Transcript_52055/g.153630 Transcript_52055/m.153630 type:complete len:152 (+) Transcript_52055:230-685(+)
MTPTACGAAAAAAAAARRRLRCRRRARSRRWPYLIAASSSSLRIFDIPSGALLQSLRLPPAAPARASSGGAASATVAAEAAPTVAAALAQAAQPWLPALELTLSFLSRARTPREAREKESGRGAATGVAAASPEATVGRPVRIDPERGLVG